jgi:hypothetical protein
MAHIDARLLDGTFTQEQKEKVTGIQGVTDAQIHAMRENIRVGMPVVDIRLVDRTFTPEQIEKATGVPGMTPEKVVPHWKGLVRQLLQRQDVQDPSEVPVMSGK